MSDYFIGEIRLFSFAYAPRYWAQCNGQLLNIVQNQALYSLLGNTYGGNASQGTFALPDLRGRVAVMPQTLSSPPAISITWGQKMGEENHILSIAEMPSHIHAASGTTAAASSTNPINNMWGTNASGQNRYATVPAATKPDVTMSSNALATAGGGGSHENMQPFLVVNYCISLMGLYPSRG